MITRTERGVRISRTGTRHYATTYRQPLLRFAVAWLYHYVWEKLTWRGMRRLERLRRRFPGADGLGYTPYTNRQDIRCFHLRHAGRVELNTTVGPLTPKDAA